MRNNLVYNQYNAKKTTREHVAQRKIVGTLRNSKGTTIHEKLMTVLAT
ncbi:MAG: hypothetical protein ACE14P_01245 [Methanotrichaceae archaeon]